MSTPHSLVAGPISVIQLREMLRSLDTRIDFEALEDDTRFRDAGADSFDSLTIVIAVQEASGITIPDGDLGNANSLNLMAKYLNERLA